MYIQERMAASLTRQSPLEYAPAVQAAGALEGIYREHFGATWRVLRRLGVEVAHLDDATQDVFLVVFRKHDEVKAGSPLKNWIYAIAVRVASDYRRRGRRRRTEPLDEAIACRAPNPAEQSEMQDAIRLLHDILNLLDEKKRTVFVLSELEQLSAPEIADVLALNLNTVYSRLRSARKEFEAALAARAGMRGEVTP